MSYLPLRDAKLLSHSVNSIRRYSVKIYDEKKAAMMVKNGYAGHRQMGLNGTEDSDAILSALCMFGFYSASVCDEGTDGSFGISESKY